MNFIRSSQIVTAGNRPSLPIFTLSPGGTQAASLFVVNVPKVNAIFTTTHEAHYSTSAERLYPKPSSLIFGLVWRGPSIYYSIDYSNRDRPNSIFPKLACIFMFGSPHLQLMFLPTVLDGEDEFHKIDRGFPYAWLLSYMVFPVFGGIAWSVLCTGLEGKDINVGDPNHFVELTKTKTRTIKHPKYKES